MINYYRTVNSELKSKELRNTLYNYYLFLLYLIIKDY